jgi:hypothetical protein
VSSFRTWRFDDVVWGVTSCEAAGCFAPAEVLADYDYRRDDGVPVCVHDADVLLERAVAIAEGGSHVELPDPWEYQRPVPRRRPAW